MKSKRSEHNLIYLYKVMSNSEFHKYIEMYGNQHEWQEYIALIWFIEHGNLYGLKEVKEG